MIISASKKRIELQTSKGNDIENEQVELELTLLLQKQIAEQKSSFINVIFKGQPTAIYNCHGMTFANRRTGIYDIKLLTTVLSDDNYIQLNSLKDVLPGDIVLYYSENGDIEHSGVVLQSNKMNLAETQILSKWGDSYEVVHAVYNCPYDLKNIKFFRSIL